MQAENAVRMQKQLQCIHKQVDCMLDELNMLFASSMNGTNQEKTSKEGNDIRPFAPSYRNVEYCYKFHSELTILCKMLG